MLPIIFIVLTICFVLERLIPGWSLPKIKTWPCRVIGINLIQLGVVVLAGLTWEKWFSGYSIFRLSEYLNPVVGGLLAYFIATFVFYWWHRLRHESDFFWLYFHQIHHSPQRLEVITSFYKHPLEMIVNSLIGSALVFTLLGLDPVAGGVYTLCTALGEFFYHTNVKTPQWIGYIFQRPEMHRIHHKFGSHKNNYGDIVWWDMLFGTYENPKEFIDTCGFTPEREERLGQMLAFQDVHKSKPASQKSVALVLAISFALGSITVPAEACSVFARSDASGRFIVGKNFDWISNDGMIVINPRGLSRSSFQAGVSKWTSKYGSLAFTPFGPGLPVSGMNEHGLVVETLVDLDFDGKLAEEGHLVSLEWAQYLLDNFRTVSEAVSFAKEHPFDQLIEPVHFFVCDDSGACAVFERRSDGVLVTTGQDLKAAVLANRSWQSDFERSKSKVWKLLTAFIPGKFSSPQRFKNLKQAVESSDSLQPKKAFMLLDASDIPPLIQWQIVWSSKVRSVSWRVFENRKPGIIRTLSFPDFDLSCKDQPGFRGPTVYGIDNIKESKYTNLFLDETQARVEKTMLYRRGIIDRVKAEKVARHTLSGTCQISK